MMSDMDKARADARHQEQMDIATTEPTAGPWMVGEYGAGLEGDEIHVTADGGCVVAAVYPMGDDAVGNRIQALNARLVAAAPDMLAACQKAITEAQWMLQAFREYGHGPDTDRHCAWYQLNEAVKKLKAAVAKTEMR